MRGPHLSPLFVPVSSLKGVGPKGADLIRKLIGSETEPRAIDLLLHAPSGLIDRRNRPRIADAQDGAIVTLEVSIDRHRPAPPGRATLPHRVQASDVSGDITLVWFKAVRARIEALLPVGETRLVSGRIAFFDGMRQMVHPDRVLRVEDADKLVMMEPVYPMTAGLSGAQLRKAIGAALARVPDLAEWQDRRLLRAGKWPRFADALTALHAPAEPADASPEGGAWTRLAYDEILAGQVALALVRADLKKPAGRRTQGEGQMRAAIVTALPFNLTNGQTESAAAITADMAAPERMIRLLQGDVGSGKTVVATLAMAAAAEAGRQSALMAPTELLARQHFRTIEQLARPSGLTVALLTGREKGETRKAVLEGLASGTIAAVVGTQALVQEPVAFRDLALAVIDEQHRFGVRERMALAAKGESVDLLAMTATPIPRTLVLTLFGDMDVSALREKPAGRKLIDTRLIATERVGDVIEAVGRAIDAGRQVYWVCPRVSETGPDDEGPALVSAEERFETLRQRFPKVVGLVHGQMKAGDRDRAMADFQTGQTRVLVATTVIEVGVDVPNASVMVIDHAERFGLAQLHQLRGRVGRGSEQSVCLLVARGPLGPIAQRRLDVMRETQDGFVIAEADLELRGEGDLVGTEQSGAASFRLARMGVHAHLVETARAEARDLIAVDPTLSTPRGQAVTDLLHLFGRAEALSLVQAG